MSSFLKNIRASLSPTGEKKKEESDGNSDDDTVEDAPLTFKAGESMKQINCPTEIEGILAAEQCWSNCDESSFLLRVGPNYAKSGAKEPSPPSLFELVGVDFLQSEKRIRDIGKKVI
ncbi:MAG: EDR2 domain-containing protein, partial [Actinomycetota bacterium]|nr:EDR2 domain-containing protein [Actinomycetota bacterium]